ncbi:MAG: DUF6391 domain-containing protein [Anaerolineae bacterium]
MPFNSLAKTLRQHHAIEHATVTLLSQRLPGVRIVAHSDLEGFTVIGDVDTATLQATVEEALARLQRGEKGLAVHPNCGTNLVTAGTLAGLSALLLASGRNRSWWDRLPSAILGATLALVVAGPAGYWMQINVTTSADVRERRVAAVHRIAGGPVVRHRVILL